MHRNALIVVGLKGHGKSTYCKLVSQYAESRGREMKIVNIDPRPGALPYTPVVDIRNQVTFKQYNDANSDSVLPVGGGFEYVLKYILDHPEWLFGSIGEGRDGDSLLFDCPGESDFYAHFNMLRHFGAMLLGKQFRVCVVHIRDARLATNGYAYISSCLSPLVSYMNHSFPHFNIMMKVDMLTEEEKSRLSLFINSDIRDVLRYENNKRGGADRKLGQTAEVASIILEGHNLIRRKYFLLDIRDEEELKDVLSLADDALGVVSED